MYFKYETQKKNCSLKYLSFQLLYYIAYEVLNGNL